MRKIKTVTNCHQLKLRAEDGKQRLTDVADAEQLLRLIQSIPSPKAELFKLWLAKAGKKGGGIAKKARMELEDKTGKSIVTGENFLPPKKEG